MRYLLAALSLVAALTIPAVAGAQSPSPAAEPSVQACPRVVGPVSSPAAVPSGCPTGVVRSPLPIRPGQIVFGTSVDPATGAVADQDGPFVAGSTVMYQAWLDPQLTFPTIRVLGYQDGVLWFDIPMPIDTIVYGSGPWTQVGGTMPAPAVAWPGTLDIQVFDAARTKLAEGSLVLVGPEGSPQG